MIKGMSFNGRHCSSLNLAMLDSRRPLLAENKDSYIEIPFGKTILIPDNSKKDTIIEVDFLLKPRTGVNIYDDIRLIVKWLDTNERVNLVFDDDPAYVYKAKVTGGVDLSRVAKARTFTVSFRCEAEKKGD